MTIQLATDQSAQAAALQSLQHLQGAPSASQTSVGGTSTTTRQTGNQPSVHLNSEKRENGAGNRSPLADSFVL